MSEFEIVEMEEKCPFVVQISLHSQWEHCKSPEIEVMERMMAKVQAAKIDPEMSCVTLINVYDVEPENQAALAELLSEGGEVHIDCSALCPCWSLPYRGVQVLFAHHGARAGRQIGQDVELLGCQLQGPTLDGGLPGSRSYFKTADHKHLGPLSTTSTEQGGHSG